MEILLEHIGKGFMYMLLISMPCVLVAAGIGLVVGILQAVTQVQEQTIAAAPKILAVFLVIMIFGGFFTKTLTNYFLESANIAFNVITHEDDFVLPASASLSSPFGGMNDKTVTQMKTPGVKEIMKHPGNSNYNERQSRTSTSRPSNLQSDSTLNIVESKKITGR
ncbi:MAG: flagellar biosynthetic protein FliQ [Candidatus Gastranaerophilaceae bacterium]|jgi:flagellar biosynthetic protein FliQ